MVFQQGAGGEKTKPDEVMFAVLSPAGASQIKDGMPKGHLAVPVAESLSVVTV